MEENRTSSPHGVSDLAAAGVANGAKIRGVADSAHQKVDQYAGKAINGVVDAAGSAHRAVDSTAAAAEQTADWAARVPEQVEALQEQIVTSAREQIRATPLIAVAVALAGGYILGRIGRR